MKNQEKNVLCSYGDIGLTDFTPLQGINARSHRKEKNFSRSFTLYMEIKDKYKNSETNTDLRPVFEARFYEISARCYCCVWVRTDGFESSGSAYAGGYGYHRESAAFEGALCSAGVSISPAFGGPGDGSITRVLMLLRQFFMGAVPCYGKAYLIHEAHG